MRRFFGYCRSLWNYVHTPKGRHDVLDYAGAAVIILLTALLAAVIIRTATGK